MFPLRSRRGSSPRVAERSERRLRISSCRIGGLAGIERIGGVLEPARSFFPTRPTDARRRCTSADARIGNRRVCKSWQELVRRVGLMQSDTEAARSDARFRRLLDGLPAAAYVCDADGLITFFNEKARALWGRAPRP